jgi:hypothetical protein
MSTRTVVQCHAHTKTGRRCSRKTARTQYCYQHLKSALNLQIKQSHIKATGMGLFTTVARKKNENIAPYSGTIVHTSDPDFGGDYVLQVRKHPPTFIDAQDTTSGPGRYANSARRGQGASNNSKLSLSPVKDNANIKATKKIAANKEIFISYGNTYWAQKQEAEDRYAKIQELKIKRK